LEWIGYHEAVKAAMANFPCPEKFTLDKSAQHPQEDSVVFICVDVEAFERNHNLITEIGIATLDTSNITSIPPGTNGTGWISAITAKHFRIKEYGHLENKEFLQGCADSFLFGLVWQDAALNRTLTAMLGRASGLASKMLLEKSPSASNPHFQIMVLNLKLQSMQLHLMHR
jgi:hypothetical protein